MSMRRKKLRAARIAKRWTQNQLAKKLKVSRTTVNYWETGVKTPSLYNQDVIAAVFGITDNEMLEHLLLLEAEGEVSEHQNTAPQSSQKEEKNLVSSPPREEMHMIRASYAPPEEDEAQADVPTAVHVPITSNVWLPKAPTLHDFIVSHMTRRFWQIAHTDYSTSDDMTNAVRAATKDFDMMNMGDTTYKITRRDALCELASIPMIALGQKQTLHTKRYEEMLRYCTAALEACWELYRGSDPIGTKHAFDCVSTYVPILETIAKDSAQYRKRALDLATQYALLQTLLGWGTWKAVSYAENALSLSEATDNIFLQLSAYTKLGWAYFRERKYLKAYETMQKGESLLTCYQHNKSGQPLPSGMIGNFNSGYALIQTKNGISPDIALGIAIDSEPLKEPIALVEFTASNQWAEAAEICCAKNDPKQALMWLEKRIDLETLASRPNIVQSERGRVNAINVLVHALLQSREQDMEYIIRVWKAGMKGSKALKVEDRYKQAIDNYERMLILWPREDRVMKLVPLTAHW